MTDGSSPSHVVRIAPAARREIKRLSKQNQRRVVAVMRALAVNPRPHGCTPVEGFDGLFKVRVGDYRVIYKIEDEELLVVIVRVRHRSDVYRQLRGLR